MTYDSAAFYFIFISSVTVCGMTAMLIQAMVFKILTIERGEEDFSRKCIDLILINFASAILF